MISKFKYWLLVRFNIINDRKCRSFCPFCEWYEECVRDGNSKVGNCGGGVDGNQEDGR